jgi:hypothetical protein
MFVLSLRMIIAESNQSCTLTDEFNEGEIFKTNTKSFKAFCPRQMTLIVIHPVTPSLSPRNFSELALSFHICIPRTCGQAGMQVKQMFDLLSPPTFHSPVVRPNHGVLVCIGCTSAGGAIAFGDKVTLS